MMLRLVLVALVLVAGCGVPAPGPGAPAAVDVAGRWTGRVDRPDAVDVVVTLLGGLDELTGTLDVPSRGVTGVPLADVSAEGGTVRFATPDAAFAGTVAADGSAIGGRWTEAGASYPLVLHRG